MQAPMGNAVQGFAGGGSVQLDPRAPGPWSQDMGARARQGVSGDFLDILPQDAQRKLSDFNLSAMGPIENIVGGIAHGDSFGSIAANMSPVGAIGRGLGLFAGGGGVDSSMMADTPYLARLKALRNVPLQTPAPYGPQGPVGGYPSQTPEEGFQGNPNLSASPGASGRGIGSAGPYQGTATGAAIDDAATALWRYKDPRYPTPMTVEGSPIIPPELGASPVGSAVGAAVGGAASGAATAMPGITGSPSASDPSTLAPDTGPPAPLQQGLRMQPSGSPGGGGGAGGVSAGTGLDAYWNQVQGLRLPNRFGELADDNRKDRADLERQKGRDAGMAILTAGLGMMAGKSQYAAENIGTGGLLGVKEFNEAQKEQRQAARDIRNADTAIAAAQANRDDSMLRSAMQLQATAEWKHESAANRAASAGIAAMDRQSRLDLAKLEFSDKSADRKEYQLLRQQTGYLGEAKEADNAYRAYSTELKDGMANGRAQPELDEIKARMEKAQQQRDAALSGLADLRAPRIGSIEEGRKRGLKTGDMFRAPDGSLKRWVDQ